jgi:hypothetical protein
MLGVVSRLRGILPSSDQDTERGEKSRGLRLGFFRSALVHAASLEATGRAGWRTPAELKLRLALLVTAEIQRET